MGANWRRRVVAVVMALLGVSLASVPMAGEAANPPPTFVGKGAAHWHYDDRDGNAALVVHFATNPDPTTPPGARVSWAVNAGIWAWALTGDSYSLQGDWTNGWEGTTNGSGTIRVGPFGDGRHIAFDLDGRVNPTSDLGGPYWHVHGEFAALTPDTLAVPQRPAADGRFVAKGITHWVNRLTGNSGYGYLVVHFDTTNPTLLPGQAAVTYVFETQLHDLAVYAGQEVVSGSWAAGWDGGSIYAGGSHLHIGPWGTGTNIAFALDGNVNIQNDILIFTPFTLRGHFTPIESY